MFLQSAHAEIIFLEALSAFSLKLAISADHLEKGTAEHSVGYLHVLSNHENCRSHLHMMYPLV